MLDDEYWDLTSVKQYVRCIRTDPRYRNKFYVIKSFGGRMTGGEQAANAAGEPHYTKPLPI